MRTKISMLVWAGIVVVSLFMTAGCRHRRVVYVREPVVVPGEPAVMPGEPAVISGEEVVVTEAPPSSQEEVVGISPGPEYIWVPGWWEWHDRWVWKSGRWMIGPHPRAHWVPGHWTRHGHTYVWRPGYWR